MSLILLQNLALQQYVFNLSQERLLKLVRQFKRMEELIICRIKYTGVLIKRKQTNVFAIF